MQQERLKQTACVMLRVKQEEEGMQQEEQAHLSGLFYCLRTGTSFGPDGKQAGLELCQPGRECHSEGSCWG